MPVVGATQRLMPVVRFVCDCALVVAIGVFMARVIWLLVSPQHALAPSASTSTPTTFTATAPRTLIVDQTVLANTNPFAQTAFVEAETAPLEEDAPETNLNLKLVGLRAASAGQGGAAFIITPDNKQVLVGEGDEILSGVTLEEVRSDRVLLKKNGQLESLMAREGTLLQTIDQAAVAEEPAAENGSGRSAVASDDSAANTPTQVAVSGRALFRSIALAPVREGGRTVGVRMVPRGDPAIMLGAGLRPGDVLLAVNGQSVSGGRLEDISDTLRAARSLQLDIEREGERQTVAISFSEESQ